MRIILLFLAIIVFQGQTNESKAQTAKQSADCLIFYKITLNKFSKGLDYTVKRDLRDSSKKAAKYLAAKSPNNYRKLIESSDIEIRAELERARKRSLKAIENYFYKMTRRCDGYKYKT